MDNEKIYKVLGQTGAFEIALGIVMIVVGTATGVLSIINGARAMKCKMKMMI